MNKLSRRVDNSTSGAIKKWTKQSGITRFFSLLTHVRYHKLLAFLFSNNYTQGLGRNLKHCQVVPSRTLLYVASSHLNVFEDRHLRPDLTPLFVCWACYRHWFWGRYFKMMLRPLGKWCSIRLWQCNLKWKYRSRVKVNRQPKFLRNDFGRRKCCGGQFKSVLECW